MPQVLHISGTPNPRAKKFHMDEAITDGAPLSFPDLASAKGHSASTALFDVEHVESVFMLDQVATISLTEQGEWDIVEPEISMILEEFCEAVDNTPKQPKNFEIPFPADFLAIDIDEQLKHLNFVLDVKVRPGLAGDGGGLELMGIDGTIVYVYYLGACGSCPSATTGTLDFIQKTLKQHAHPSLTVELS